MLQLKSTLAEKERLKDDLDKKSEILDDGLDKTKQMEIQISTLVAQKT